MKFEETVLKSHPTGSRYICDPPVLNTDNDTVILVNGYHPWQQMLLDDGWEQCGNYEFGGEFDAFRKGEDNYIVTEDPDFFNRYVFATEGAKALNLTNKDDRIKLFQAIGSSGEGYVGLRNKYPADQLLDQEFEPAPLIGAVPPGAVFANEAWNFAPAIPVHYMEGGVRDNPFQAAWDRHQF